MKRNLSKCFLAILAICFFSTKTFAQGPANPSGDPHLEFVKMDSADIIESLPTDSNNIMKNQNGAQEMNSNNLTAPRLLTPPVSPRKPLQKTKYHPAFPEKTEKADVKPLSKKEK